MLDYCVSSLWPELTHMHTFTLILWSLHDELFKKGCFESLVTAQFATAVPRCQFPQKNLLSACGSTLKEDAIPWPSLPAGTYRAANIQDFCPDFYFFFSSWRGAAGVQSPCWRHFLTSALAFNRAFQVGPPLMNRGTCFPTRFYRFISVDVYSFTAV